MVLPLLEMTPPPGIVSVAAPFSKQLQKTSVYITVVHEACGSVVSCGEVTFDY